MDQTEEPEEGVPKTSLTEEDQSLRMKRPKSPEPSCVSIGSDRSKDFPIHFKVDPPAGDRLDHGGRHRLRPGLKKWSCELEVDTETLSRRLRLSEDNRTVTWMRELQSYPDHPDRFDGLYPQLLCRSALSGRCYWEVQWKRHVYVSVSYRNIGRTGDRDKCMFGANDQSWSLSCSGRGYSVYHNNKETFSSSSSSPSGRVAVFVDYPAGSLSFYEVSSDGLIHLHTTKTTFTEPLYPGFGFGFWFYGSLSLCPLDCVV